MAPPPDTAWLPVNVLLLITSDAETFRMAPPPSVEAAVTRLPVNVQLLMVRALKLPMAPPPKAVSSLPTKSQLVKVVIEPRDRAPALLVLWLFTKVLPVTLRVPVKFS